MYKIRYFIFILFVLPSLVWGSFNESSCLKNRDEARSNLNRTQELIAILNSFSFDQKQEFIETLHKAIKYCDRAYGIYDEIIYDIEQQHKSKRDKSWHKAMKKACIGDKEHSLDLLKALRKELYSRECIPELESLYMQGIKKIEEGSIKEQEFSSLFKKKLLLASDLEEIIALYEDGCSYFTRAITLLVPTSLESEKINIKKLAEDAEVSINRCKKELISLPATILQRRVLLQDELFTLQEESFSLETKGLTRSLLDVQMKMNLIVSQLIVYGEEGLLTTLNQVQEKIELLKADSDAKRVTEDNPSISLEEFILREVERRELFFASTFIPPVNIPNVLALEEGDQNNFTLYAEQFYRFKVKSSSKPSSIVIKVYEDKDVIHEEKIDIPLKHTLAWDHYLIEEGMVLIPETRLKKEFGLNLHLRILNNPQGDFSLLITEKGSSLTYQYSIFLDNQLLYNCNFISPLPWQLGVLYKPKIQNPLVKLAPAMGCPAKQRDHRLMSLLLPSSSPLDLFVEEIKEDPLLIAQYIYNEIDLVDPFLRKENGVFEAPPIHRGVLQTFLEKQGSPWEQCRLLIDLLRRAGHFAVYATGASCVLPKAFVENMLFVEGLEEKVFLKYPWVLLKKGNEWISLFPWMKESFVTEGLDLYDGMPEEYASADRFIGHYLKNDEGILKHIGPDGDDTLGVLFTRLLEESARKKGLSLQDFGINRTPLKKQFSSWGEFPRAEVQGDFQTFLHVEHQRNLFAKVQIIIESKENPVKQVGKEFFLADLENKAVGIKFSPNEAMGDYLRVDLEDSWSLPDLSLDATDHTIVLKVIYKLPVIGGGATQEYTFPITKGTSAALSFHLGGTNGVVPSLLNKQIGEKTSEEEKIQALLAFTGSAYFEKCSRMENLLAALHKLQPKTILSLGLAKISPDLSQGGVQSKSILKYPQVDMRHLESPVSFHFSPRESYKALIAADRSSNEHQIIREVFQDPYAISTVKLLQIAHEEHQKKGYPGSGFLVLTSNDIHKIENSLEMEKCVNFPHLKDLNLRTLKADALGQWKIIGELLDLKVQGSEYAYAYMTPGVVGSQDGNALREPSYRGIGTFIIHPDKQYSLISQDSSFMHGGFGSPLSDHYIKSIGIPKEHTILSMPLPTPIKDFPEESCFNLQQGQQQRLEQELERQPLSARDYALVKADVREPHKSMFDCIADPVDIISGAFYIDEVDMVLPGVFPLSIRRNYNSQNPLRGSFGYGWKLSLNPTLEEEEGKLFAAEEDGTVIAYRLNKKKSRWEVYIEDNPDLRNLSAEGIRNPFQNYIENNILYGSDGSKRIFEGHLLRKWIDAIGNALIFSYEKGLLTKIENASSFCRINYDAEGRIFEIIAKDGRRIGYSYSLAGDLKEVEFPNKAITSYEYDRFHQIFRETKPHGKVLENIYDKEGRVRLQRSPILQDQKMGTSATFTYEENIRMASDASGATTTYKIFDKKIYKIVDPKGYEILLSWFVDEHTYFDPKKEAILPFEGAGGWRGSLKSSQDKRGLITSYLYDKNGNAEIVSLTGSDLTGDDKNSIFKKYTYNDINLCISEETLNRKKVTTYDSIFPYLPKRIENYIEETLLAYVDFEYNPKGRLLKENRAGAITHYEYDSKDLLYKITQKTGTEDPDVITTFAYNHQGQCIEKVSSDGVQKEEYDLLGNRYLSSLYSLNGKLLSESHVRYNLNNQCILTYGIEGKDPLYLDYNTSGLLKASRQEITEENRTAYTLYEYDSRGLLCEEVDPLGNSTFRTYDELGRIASLTKDGHATTYEYEAGGQLAILSTPRKGKISRFYTTNGLLKEEVFPDGQVNSFIYDFFGRPIQEIYNGILTVTTYDDKNRRILKTEQEKVEVQQFDERGNLICLTDPLGYRWEKTYDGLNRLTSEMTPTGEKTTFSYQGDTVICTQPSLERVVRKIEMGHVVESMTYDKEGVLIASFTSSFDPKLNQEVRYEGDVIQITQMNTYGKPTQITKGELTSSYGYDLVGNCVTSIDGDGYTTIIRYDSLGRIFQKELPDGAVITYAYDLDSNLTECHMPNSLIWKASYDLMGRKYEEELVSSEGSSQQFTYTYEEGLLKEMTDPLNRVHSYSYDSYQRLIEDNIEGWNRTYTYDFMDRLTSLEESGLERSFIERKYDPSGRIFLENIYLNAELVQQTHQTWKAAYRSLEIQDHKREFFYQGGQVKQIVSNHLNLAYEYNLNGSLKRKISPLTQVSINYNKSSLPEKIQISLPLNTSIENLTWHPSGKLATHSISKEDHYPKQAFTYNARGHLSTSQKGSYEFDFGSPGLGILTRSPESLVEEVDPFGKVHLEKNLTSLIKTTYDPMGQVSLQNDKTFIWDPWGRLISVTSDAYTWKAFYDGLGRRLRTQYIPKEGFSIVTTSFYDPEEEFQEIGITYNEKTFWKIYGPISCDALLDSKGFVVYLMQDALRHLTEVVSAKEVIQAPKFHSPYGPTSFTTSSDLDLIEYALSLAWQDKNVDPTGLIWMGARYYDPKGGRFLSPDPISYPACLDLYTYANGDPVNFFDPNGRFASKVYQTIRPAVIDAFDPLSGFNQVSRGCNGVVSYCANNGFTRSGYLKKGALDLPNGSIGFINGINNTEEEFFTSANQLSEYAQGTKIHGIYNRTNTISLDILECVIGHLGFHTPPVQLLKNKWDFLIATHSAEAKFLEFCHSGGADHLKNALLESSDSVRQRIIVVAIAPSVIIPRSLCYKSDNYISRRDLVTHTDIVGKLKYGDELIILKPDAEASFWDHDFRSPTFDAVKRDHINRYIKNYGGKK